MHNSLAPLHMHLCLASLPSQSRADNHHRDKLKASLRVFVEIVPHLFQYFQLLATSLELHVASSAVPWLITWSACTHHIMAEMGLALCAERHLFHKVESSVSNTLHYS